MAIFQDNLPNPVPECHRSDFIASKDDGSGGHNWNYKTSKSVKLSWPANQHPAFYRQDAIPDAKATVLELWGKKVSHFTDLLP